MQEGIKEGSSQKQARDGEEGRVRLTENAIDQSEDGSAEASPVNASKAGKESKSQITEAEQELEVKDIMCRLQIL